VLEVIESIGVADAAILALWVVGLSVAFWWYRRSSTPSGEHLESDTVKPLDSRPTEIDVDHLVVTELRDWTACPNCESRQVWTWADRSDNTLALECRDCEAVGTVQVGRPLPGGPAVNEREYDAV